MQASYFLYIALYDMSYNIYADRYTMHSYYSCIHLCDYMTKYIYQSYGQNCFRKIN